MRQRTQRLGLTLLCAATALTLHACGGRSEDEPDRSSEERGGSANGGRANGGSANGGQPIMGGLPGTGGSVATECEYAGEFYAQGTSFAAGDGCNTCRCSPIGVSCTTKACDACAWLDERYPTELRAAKTCNPALSVEQCTRTIAMNPECGCPTFVNAKNVESLEVLELLLKDYGGKQCGTDVSCELCLPPLRGICSPEGVCEDAFAAGRSSCKVGAVVYLDGSTKIPKPSSCNTCSCSDGALSCTEAGCDACPAGTAFGVQCAECGPTDACLLPEYDCYPTCSDQCPGGQVCLGGLCKTSICG